MDAEITMPVGYRWLIDRKLIGFEPFTQLQPWYYIPAVECFWAAEKWPHVTNRRLFVFARRQDNDDLACVSFDENGAANGVVQIQGWTEAGFEITENFPDFWFWVQGVIRDVSEWVALG